MNKAPARRGLDRVTHRKLGRYQQLLLIVGVVSVAVAAAVLVAMLLGHLLNGAIAA